MPRNEQENLRGQHEGTHNKPVYGGNDEPCARCMRRIRLNNDTSANTCAGASAGTGTGTAIDAKSGYIFPRGTGCTVGNCGSGSGDAAFIN